MREPRPAPKGRQRGRRGHSLGGCVGRRWLDCLNPPHARQEMQRAAVRSDHHDPLDFRLARDPIDSLVNSMNAVAASTLGTSNTNSCPASEKNTV